MAHLRPLVLGVEADIDGLRGKPAIGGTFPVGPPQRPTTTFTLNTTAQADWLMTLRGRLGMASGPWMFYGTGGAASAKIKVIQSFSDNCCGSTPLTTASDTETKSGYALGGGGE